MDFDISNIINAISDFFNSISNFLDNNYKRLAAIAAILTIGTFIYRKVKAITVPNTSRKKELRDKLDGFTDDKILSLIKSKRFIPTMGQQEPPHEDDAIFISPKREPLIDKIINDIFDKDHLIDKKRYMILGGSGMGKSTFSAALLYHYLFKYRFKKSPYPIYIISLEKPDVIEQIKNLASGDSVKQSIIILDALDESNEASNDVSKFMDELDEITKDFRYVIITCRTQFFENEESEPNKLKIHISGASKRTLEYDRIYVSPFTEKEAKRYLRRKFGFDLKSYYKALRISKKCWDVLSRPMILSFIDDLMEIEDIENTTKVEIYSKIIDKWFDREIEMRNIEKSLLYSFSKELAVFMYDKWIKSENAYVSTIEYKKFLRDNGYKDSPYSFRTRSLINRNTNGDIKFSHKSFWEFFLAIYFYENPGKPFVANGLNLLERFVIDFNSLSPSEIKIDIEKNNRLSLIINPMLYGVSLEQHLDRLYKIQEFINSIRTKNDNGYDTATKQYILSIYLNEAFNLLFKALNSRFEKKGERIINYSLYNAVNESIINIIDFTILLVHHIFDSFASNDVDALRACSDWKTDYLDNINKYIQILNNINKTLAGYYSLENSKILIKNKFIFTISNTTYSGIEFFRIGHSGLFGDRKVLPPLAVVFIDSDQIEEITNYLNEWTNSTRLYANCIIINIKYRSNSLNYIIDDYTRDYSPEIIKIILTRMITTATLDESRYSKIVNKLKR